MVFLITLLREIRARPDAVTKERRVWLGRFVVGSVLLFDLFNTVL